MLIKLPSAIVEFIGENHVLGLAVLNQGMPWAASCFYAFEPEAATLFIMTSSQTRHGGAMLRSPNVAGTIGGQPEGIRNTRGIQFTARANLLSGDARSLGMSRYLARHPLARLKSTDLWSLPLEELKFTDTRHVLARRTIWYREDKARQCQAESH